MIVADCSVIAPLFVESERTQQAKAVLARDAGWIVPPLWRSELRSVFRKYLLHASLPIDRAIDGMDRAERMFGDRERTPNSGQVLTLVQATRCSAYDAEYIALARSLDVVLVTADRGLAELFPGVALSPSQYLEAR